MARILDRISKLLLHPLRSLPCYHTRSMVRVVQRACAQVCRPLQRPTEMRAETNVTCSASISQGGINPDELFHDESVHEGRLHDNRLFQDPQAFPHNMSDDFSTLAGLDGPGKKISTSLRTN
jgi:hypothetical protein